MSPLHMRGSAEFMGLDEAPQNKIKCAVRPMPIRKLENGNYLHTFQVMTIHLGPPKSVIGTSIEVESPSADRNSQQTRELMERPMSLARLAIYNKIVQIEGKGTDGSTNQTGTDQRKD